MTRVIALVAVALLATPAMAARDPARAEAELQKTLAGRTAEAPRQCILLRPGLDSQIAGNALIYRESNSLWYVNRPSDGQCQLLTRDVLPVVSAPSTQLCRGDIVQLYTRAPAIELGGCALGEFVPYRRAPRTR